MRNLTTLPTFTIRHLWTSILLALLMAGTAFVPGTAAQSSVSPQLVVVTEALNVRSGPGTTYPAIGLLVQGEEAPVIGHNSASGWWQVQLPDDSIGWVSGAPAYVSVNGDTAGLPEVATPVIPSAEPATTSSATYSGAESKIVFQTVSGGPIYVIDADSGNLRYLTTGMDPALSPDGQWVAFTRWDDVQRGAFGSLWIINVDGSGEQAILGEIRQPKSPVWSPDGRQIALSMQHGGRIEEERKCSGQRPPRGAYDVDVSRKASGDVEFCYTLPPHPYWGLRMVDVMTGEFQDLANDLFSYSPAWDPANTWRLVYDGERGLLSLDLNQGTTWSLTDDVNDHSPIFSPDGSRIAVSYWQHDHWEIHALTADGTSRVRLTETPVQARLEQMVNGEMPHSWNNVAPAWSPDGSQIAFLTDRTGGWEIWIMSADGSNQRPLVSAGVLDGVTLEYDGMDERVLSWR